MDNHNFVLQRVRDVVKTTTFYTKYAGFGLLDEPAGNALLRERLCGETPFLAARGGATEMRCLAEHLAGKAVFSDTIRRQIAEFSGVFSNDDDSLHRFCTLYESAMTTADFLAVWDVGAERRVAGQMRRAGGAVFGRIRSLEPYYFDAPWTAALAGQKVLVVHPFAQTIRAQYTRRTELFANPDVLPAFASLTVLPAVQSIAGQHPDFASWFDALDSMKAAISATDFDVALIGAGAYGLPLAAHCKALGKKAVQTSGATQLLFGIRGRRWDDHPVIGRLYNESWVRPSAAETPAAKNVVEGGSYW